MVINTNIKHRIISALLANLLLHEAKMMLLTETPVTEVVVSVALRTEIIMPLFDLV